MVDLSTKEFDLRDAAQAGAWCQLHHPVTRQPLGAEEGKPARILVQGVDSTGFEKAVAKTQALRANEQPYNGPITDDRLMFLVDQAAKFQARELSEVSLRFEHIEWEGAPVDAPSKAIPMYTNSKWIREQVIAFVAERQNYAGNGSAPL